MEGFDGCQLRASSALDNSKCYAAAKAFAQEAVAIVRYWSHSVELSGGAASTKNKME